MDNRKAGSDLGLEFDGDWESDDKAAFVYAAKRQAKRMYDVYCGQRLYLEYGCRFDSPEELFKEAYGTTVMTASNTSANYFCERNANPGSEGVSCYSNSRGDIDGVIASHELGHVFNALISNNGFADPYDDLATERKKNEDFPAIGIGITPGHKTNTAKTNGEDYANMHSMWVFDDWGDSVGGADRKSFMDNNMLTWINRLLAK